MRTKREIEDRLLALQELAYKENPTEAVMGKVPLTKIENVGLRIEIYTLMWVLDLIG